MTPLQNRAWALVAKFLADRRGDILVELAFGLPVMLLLIIGSFDMARLLLLHQKLDRVSAITADLVSRPSSISQGDIDNMFTVAQDVLAPFDLSANGRVIVSSVSKVAGENAKVDWQRSGGGSLSVTSHIGTPGSTPTLPGGFVVADDENLIIAEVFYDNVPIMLDHFGVMTPGQLSQSAIRRPRRGDLTTLNP